MELALKPQLPLSCPALHYRLRLLGPHHAEHSPWSGLSLDTRQAADPFILPCFLALGQVKSRSEQSTQTHPVKVLHPGLRRPLSPVQGQGPTAARQVGTVGGF